MAKKYSPRLNSLKINENTNYNGLNLTLPSLQLIAFSSMEYEIYESHLSITHELWKSIILGHDSLLFLCEQLYDGGKKLSSYSHALGYKV